MGPYVTQTRHLVCSSRPSDDHNTVGTASHTKTRDQMNAIDFPHRKESFRNDFSDSESYVISSCHSCTQHCTGRNEGRVEADLARGEVKGKNKAHVKSRIATNQTGSTILARI